MRSSVSPCKRTKSGKRKRKQWRKAEVRIITLDWISLTELTLMQLLAHGMVIIKLFCNVVAKYWAVCLSVCRTVRVRVCLWCLFMISALRPAMHSAPDINNTGLGYFFYNTSLVISMDWNTALHKRVVHCNCFINIAVTPLTGAWLYPRWIKKNLLIISNILVFSQLLP